MLHCGDLPSIEFAYQVGSLLEAQPTLAGAKRDSFGQRNVTEGDDLF